MSRETIVVGAGMVGVSVAWHLAQRGRSVLLLDRQPPGQETSFGNAGLIQREAVRPYAFPRDLGTLLSVLPNQRADIRYGVEGMLSAAKPLFSYWRHSAPRAYARIIPEYASLIMLSTQEHAPMMAAAEAEGLVKKQGWLEVYRTEAELQARLVEAEDNAVRFGVTYDSLDADELRRREPQIGAAPIGAVHWTNAWGAVDPGALVAAYARAVEAAGGRFLQAEVRDIQRAGEGWRVTTSAGAHQAEEVVLALGPWASDWLQPMGYRLPMFVKRGYHMHYAAREGQALTHWLLDAEVGYLLAPMRAGVRLTTGAELQRREAPPRSGQLEAAEAQARRFYPGLGERLDPEPWRGARPCLPDMKPVIGPAPRHPGLWLAFGHGHQGFTLGPATGRLLAEMMEGETPAVDMTPFRVDRF